MEERPSKGRSFVYRNTSIPLCFAVFQEKAPFSTVDLRSHFITAPLRMIQSLLRIRRSLSSNSTAVVSLFLVGLLLLLAGVPESWAQKGKPVDTERLQQKTETKVQDPTQPSVSFLDVTNSTLMIRRDGLFPFEDPFTDKNGSFPCGAEASVVFAQCLLNRSVLGWTFSQSPVWP
jgi:hypothetical protein